MPLNAWWTAGELEYGIDDSGARLLFVDDERYQRLRAHAAALPALERMIVSRASTALDDRASRLEDLIGTPGDYATLPETALPAVEIAPDDEATIFYTSGTTGNPKGALGTHRNMTTQHHVGRLYRRALAAPSRRRDPGARPRA